MSSEPVFTKFDMPPHLDEPGARRSLEATAAKWVNVVMISVLVVAALAFTAWHTFHQTILLIQAAPNQRWQHVEGIFAAVAPALLILIIALGMSRRIKA
jgi:hypothetical protein